MWSGESGFAAFGTKCADRLERQDKKGMKDMTDKKEYIERWALIEKSRKVSEYDEAGFHVSYNAVSVGDIYEAPAADVVSRGVFEQIKWERDMAMQQLEEHGIPFGAKADVVAVVRCKDCDYWKDTSDDTATEPHWGECRKPLGDYRYCETAECDFCSYGERKEQT